MAKLGLEIQALIERADEAIAHSIQLMKERALLRGKSGRLAGEVDFLRAAIGPDLIRREAATSRH